jgi:tRNA(Ile)-lysidine synthetase-like protein
MDKIRLEIIKTLRGCSTVVLSISGGVDSMVLYDILNKIKDEIKIRVVCVHFNHGLREASDTEEEYIKSKCTQDNNLIEIFKYKKKPKENMHESARNFRYQKLLEVSQKYDADFILTAHHMDDTAETLLFKIARGTTLKSLATIRSVFEVEGKVIYRPFLNVSKDQIREHSSKEDIFFFEDESNEENAYSRNYIRNEIIPDLKIRNKQFLRNVNNLIDDMSDYTNYIDLLIDKAYEKAIMSNGSLNIEQLLKNDDFIIKQIFKKYIWNNYKGKTTNLNIKQFKQAYKMIYNPKPSLFTHMSEKKQIIKKDGTLFIGLIDKGNSYNYKFTEKIKIGNWSFTTSNTYGSGNDCCCLSSEDIKTPLYFRNYIPGDKILLKGLEKNKKIADIFIDEKVSKFERKSFPILVDANGKILWVPNFKKSVFCKSKNENYDIIIKCKKENENE